MLLYKTLSFYFIFGIFICYGADNSIEKNHETSTKKVEQFADLIKKGTPYINFRYRFEQVNQKGLTRRAKASTLRSKVGFKTGVYKKFSGHLELRNVLSIGNDSYNSTLNRKSRHPVVADPEAMELTRGNLKFTGIPKTTIVAGRQGINLDSQRFVGTVGWRQNDQTFDAVHIVNKALPDTKIYYGFVGNVNRVLTHRHPNGTWGMRTHLINASYSGLEIGKFTVYGYLIDLDKKHLKSKSSDTFGLNFSGSTDVARPIKLLYKIEYAVQRAYLRKTPRYYALEGGVGYSSLTLKLGLEILGTDKSRARSFQTPLATLHKFNGWADKFLVTPSNGLHDSYINLTYKIKDIHKTIDDTRFHIAYHKFSSHRGNMSYRKEWNGSLTRSFLDHFNVGLKYANFRSKNFATNTQKFWFTFGVKY